uniref:Uncharacterized protein n=1 Tax=Salix viminalis TaxID=40686 RepID=A0A6N2KA33_SALVM
MPLMLSLEVMEQVAKKVVFDIRPYYTNIHLKIFAHIINLPIYDQIRNIRQIHMNTVIRVGGVVTSNLRPFFQNSYSEVQVGSCPELQLKGPFTVNIEQTLSRNYQKLILLRNYINGFPGSVIETNYVTKKQDLFSA